LLRATGWALVAGPALFLADNLIHPEEVGRGNEAEQLAAIAANADRWQIAHMLGFAGLVVITAGVLGLAGIAWRRERRLALRGGAAATVGALALAFAFALDGYTWGVLGEVSGREGIDATTMNLAFGEVQDSAWAVPYYGLVVVWSIGVATLAFAARRGGWIHNRAANLLGVAAFAVALEGLIADNTYFIASAALLLIGGVDCCRDLLRATTAPAGEIR
jgi:hypothetical protein